MFNVFVSVNSVSYFLKNVVVHMYALREKSTWIIKLDT